MNILILSFVLNFLLLLPLFDINYVYISIILLSFFLLLFLIIKPEVCIKLSLLSIFLGTLLSIDLGFTLKASHIFSFLFLISSFALKKYKIDKIYNFIPIIILLVFFIPSLFSDEIENNPTRYFFNLFFLIIITVSIYNFINNEKNLKTTFNYIFISYLVSLLFGIFQQIGYYLGIYNPNDYIGFHSTFVDFYGPFLRISPGTFANEYGQIIQTICICLVIYFSKHNKGNLFLYFVFILSLIALLINFTRISWIIFASFLILFFIRKHTLKTIFSTSLILVVLFYLENKFGLLSYFYILDRIFEILNLSEGTSSGIRFNQWVESLGKYENNYLIGLGLGSRIETHNIFIEILSETGIIGLFGLMTFYLSLLFYSYKNYKIRKDFYSYSILLTMISNIVFDITNHGLYHFIFWINIAIGLAIKKLNS
jgi:O-antigen ligase